MHWIAWNSDDGDRDDATTYTTQNDNVHDAQDAAAAFAEQDFQDSAGECGHDDSDEAVKDPLEWHLRYGTPTRSQMLSAADILAAYRALVTAGTTAQQTRRLAALRRVWRRR